jgi:kinesin family protein 15
MLQEKEVRRDEKLKFTCKCSFLEIYNEQILDLLDPSSNNLQVMTYSHHFFDV